MQAQPIERKQRPITLREAKSFLRIYDTEHDLTINLLINAAISAIEGYTRQTFVPMQYTGITQRLPVALPAFPVISIDKLETYTAGSWTDVPLSERLPFPKSISQYIAGNWDHYILDNVTPPVLVGSQIAGVEGYRITWTAGYENLPDDVKLLILQTVEENFDSRGTTPDKPQGVKFSAAHELMLEQLRTHHDSIRLV